MRKRTRKPSPSDEIQELRDRLVILDGIAGAMRDPMVLLEVVVAAEDPDTAISGLRHRFGLSEVQAVAVLDLQFRRATRRDRGRLEEGRQEVLEELRRLESAGE